MAEFDGKVQEFLNDPVALPFLKKALKDPERWARYRYLTFEQVAAAAEETGYYNPEVVALTCEVFRAIAELSPEEVQKLISRLEEVDRNGKEAR